MRLAYPPQGGVWGCNEKKEMWIFICLKYAIPGI